MLQLLSTIPPHTHTPVHSRLSPTKVTAVLLDAVKLLLLFQLRIFIKDLGLIPSGDTSQSPGIFLKSLSFSSTWTVQSITVSGKGPASTGGLPREGMRSILLPLSSSSVSELYLASGSATFSTPSSNSSPDGLRGGRAPEGPLPTGLPLGSPTPCTDMEVIQAFYTRGILQTYVALLKGKKKQQQKEFSFHRLTKIINVDLAHSGSKQGQTQTIIV